MLGNTIELWEVMLAITKIGAVSIPTSTLLSASDLAYRVEHGRARAIVTQGALAERVSGLDAGILHEAPEAAQDHGMIVHHENGGHGDTRPSPWSE
jgi:acyl-coenzyme A synthetase/AMP-(fatty) acid ligase